MTETSTATAGLELDIQYAADTGEPPTPDHVRATLTAALPAGADVTVRFVSEAESHATNLRHLGKDRPANVLAFPYAGPRTCGDIAICPPVVERQARECGVAAADAYAHMLVHAALHLRGMRHDEPAQATAMESQEAAILATLDIADPYASERR